MLEVGDDHRPGAHGRIVAPDSNSNQGTIFTGPSEVVKGAGSGLES